ncbi:hypothetical protein R3I94_013098 [Phoxinus phoxinus]
MASCVHHEVFSYEDFQRLRNENRALREENQALRESNARVASDDSGSLQEQVKQVGTMLKTFARTGQSGADQTLMLRRLGEFGDVVPHGPQNGHYAATFQCQCVCWRVISARGSVTPPRHPGKFGVA